MKFFHEIIPHNVTNILLQIPICLFWKIVREQRKSSVQISDSTFLLKPDFRHFVHVKLDILFMLHFKPLFALHQIHGRIKMVITAVQQTEKD